MIHFDWSDFMMNPLMLKISFLLNLERKRGKKERMLDSLLLYISRGKTKKILVNPKKEDGLVKPMHQNIKKNKRKNDDHWYVLEL
jgi:hypothetical protein